MDGRLFCALLVFSRRPLDQAMHEVTDRGCMNHFQRAALEGTCPKLVRTGNLGVPPEDLRIASGRAPTPGGLRGPDRCRAGVARGTHPPKSPPQEIPRRRQRRGPRGPFGVGQDVSAHLAMISWSRWPSGNECYGRACRMAPDIS